MANLSILANRSWQYLVAVAIPLSSVSGQRVYMAFNFEAHFGIPTARSTISAIKMPVSRLIHRSS